MAIFPVDQARNLGTKPSVDMPETEDLLIGVERTIGPQTTVDKKPKLPSLNDEKKKEAKKKEEKKNRKKQEKKEKSPKKKDKKKNKK